MNSAGGSFGLAFGLAFAGAIMLASLSLVFTHKSDSSTVLSSRQKQQVSKGLEKNAEVMTNTHLEELLAGQPRDVKEEILRINTEARPIALQIALLVPLLAALLGLVDGLPDDPATRPRAVSRRRDPARRLKPSPSGATARSASAGRKIRLPEDDGAPILATFRAEARRPPGSAASGRRARG